MNGLVGENVNMIAENDLDKGGRERSAFNNVKKSINHELSFPSNVFRGCWGVYMFFEADRLFASSFASVATKLLRAEGADFFCLLNFDEIRGEEDELEAALFLHKGIDQISYADMLREGGAAKGWLFGSDRYGGSSDLGGWSIYCEKSNDIAVIAIRQALDKEKYSECLNQLNAAPIAELLALGSAAVFPFSKLIESWRYGLKENYPCYQK